MLFSVFPWEREVVNFVTNLTQDEYFHRTMEFFSNFSESGVLISVLVIAYWIYKQGIKIALSRTFFIVCSVLIADFIARRIFKALIQRPRPNFDGIECLKSYCWGFPSNHATNTALVATLLIMINKKNAYWAIPAMVTVGFSRMYLGSHFPLDVLAGFFLGFCIAKLIVYFTSLFKKDFLVWPPPTK